MSFIKEISKEQRDARQVPDFEAGDRLCVMVTVKEGTREREQAYTGVCIARHNNGISSSFVVRKVSYGEGVERVFPLYSPKIRIIVERCGKVRRAKLYYLRDRSGKSARIAENFARANKKAAESKSSDAAAPSASAEVSGGSEA